MNGLPANKGGYEQSRGDTMMDSSWDKFGLDPIVVPTDKWLQQPHSRQVDTTTADERWAKAATWADNRQKQPMIKENIWEQDTLTNEISPVVQQQPAAAMLRLSVEIEQQKQQGVLNLCTIFVVDVKVV